MEANVQPLSPPAPTPTTGADGTASTPPAPSWTLLCVDDEPSILSALRRLFRSGGWRVLTAEGGAAALELLEKEKVDLIISDMRMPYMDGAQLLEQVKLRWPSVTRLLLTGYADVESTIAAINRGQIHRYLTKPWNDDEILLIVRDIFERRALEEDKRRLEALTQRQNDELKALNASLESKVEERTAELTVAHDKMKKNYLTSIKAFSSLIEQRGGSLVGHARRVADLARRMAQQLQLPEAESRDVFIAGLLHDIGQIGLSDVILAKPVPRMTPDELHRYRLHPIQGEQTLMALDDMQEVAALIRLHHERFDGQGFPDGLAGPLIPLGARILALAETYDDLQSGHLGASGLTPDQARTVIVRGRGTQFDPAVLDAFLELFPKAPAPPEKPLVLRSDELRPGMVLAKDFLSDEGVLLLAAEHVLTADLIARIRTLEKRLARSLMLSIKPAPAQPPRS
ncbi:HD domain-containing phosphohydrolase [Aquabacterium sp.]|uniref:HD domain-containing phosphohydrolase n=1 Tax=Aquabacterium sp. TaxID=1872578 RepID=UPI0035AEF7A2